MNISIVTHFTFSFYNVAFVCSYKFHAQPVNEEIFKKQVGVKKVPSKELTKPVDVEMETDRRLQYRHEHDKSVEQVGVIHEITLLLVSYLLTLQ